MMHQSKRIAILSAILLTLGAGAASAQSAAGNGGGAGGAGGFGGDPGGGMYEAFGFAAAPPPPRNRKGRTPQRQQICGGIESVHVTEFQRCPR